MKKYEIYKIDEGTGGYWGCRIETNVFKKILEWVQEYQGTTAIVQTKLRFNGKTVREVSPVNLLGYAEMEKAHLLNLSVKTVLEYIEAGY